MPNSFSHHKFPSNQQRINLKEVLSNVWDTFQCHHKSVIPPNRQIEGPCYFVERTNFNYQKNSIKIKEIFRILFKIPRVDILPRIHCLEKLLFRHHLWCQCQCKYLIIFCINNPDTNFDFNKFICQRSEYQFKNDKPISSDDSRF